MKKLIFILFVFAINHSVAQKNIDGLINAEKNFAAYSVRYGTKDAFLKFIDSNGIVFDQNKPVNGIEVWTKREKRPGVLNWRPQFAEISLSQDLGYTTGPWTFQPKTIADSVAARGQYFTIWHWRDSAWKFLLDLGTNLSSVNSSINTVEIDVDKQTGNGRFVTSLLKAEQNFVSAIRRNTSRAYDKYLSKQFCILCRNNNLPATTKIKQEVLIKGTSSSLKYKIDGYGIASSGDLGYVYGTTNLFGKTDNYVRVWRKEKGGWTIALEVLRY
jgi:hypothetical protein